MSNLTHKHNGSLKPSKYEEDCEFPMKHFKGTKFFLDKCEGNLKVAYSDRKRKAGASFDNESQLKIEKKLKSDPLKVLRKLEKFSDVWNDCPNVENPKSYFENQTPTGDNEKEAPRIERYETFNGCEKKSTRSKETNTWSNFNERGRIPHFEKPYRETNDHHQRCNENTTRTLEKGLKNNAHKDLIAEVDTTKSKKYDSKLAELKRKKAVLEQIQLHTDQKNIIKKALSSMDGKKQANKKIIFNEAEDDGETQNKIVLEENKSKTHKLFNDDDLSESDFELKINSQFEGKKGQKLLELQTRIAADSRFSLDSRFHESESEDEEKEATPENIHLEDEKKRQLEILESIVKQPIRPLSERKKILGKKYGEPWKEMVRFDPTREDHQKYVLNPQDSKKEEKVKEKQKKSKSVTNIQERKPEVSSEKVYDVKENLKEVLQTEHKTEFSLLKLFGSKEDDSNTQQESSESIKKLKYATKNPFRYDSSESEEEEEKKAEEEKNKSVTKPSLPSWRTTFFFTDNDSRLKEADEFLKRPEGTEDDQEFAEKRKMLKDFIRHKFKNTNRKKDPFKKKLGGVKQKAFHKRKGK